MLTFANLRIAFVSSSSLLLPPPTRLCLYYVLCQAAAPLTAHWRNCHLCNCCPTNKYLGKQTLFSSFWAAFWKNDVFLWSLNINMGPPLFNKNSFIQQSRPRSFLPCTLLRCLGGDSGGSVPGMFTVCGVCRDWGGVRGADWRLLLLLTCSPTLLQPSSRWIITE